MFILLSCLVISMSNIEEKLEKVRKKWEEFDKEAREIRRKMANWDFINKQPPLIKKVLIYYIETGDIRRACKLARMKLEEFRELLRKANIPVVT